MADDPDGPALTDALAAITKQLEAATSALHESALTPADLSGIAEHLLELVEYGWHLANAAADHVTDDAETYLTHTKDLLSVAITTTGGASRALHEMEMEMRRQTTIP